MRKTLTLAVGAYLIVAMTACGNRSEKEQNDVSAAPSTKIIFETDMGNDVDDALALDMLFKYLDAEEIELLGISTNKNDEGSLEYIDAMCTWYGYPEIPLGYVVNGVDSRAGENYAYKAMQLKDNAGNPAFKQSHANDGFAIPSVELYRRLLASQPDMSVTVVSVGFSTNLAALLESQPDSISPLLGRDLVAQKVKSLVVMAGNIINPKHSEFNVNRDIPAAQKVFAEWPNEIVVSPWELGEQIKYPATSIENDFNWAEIHPMVEGYKAYLPMPYDRQTWDLTAVLYAVEGSDGFFTVSEPGTIIVNENGNTLWSPEDDGRMFYLQSDEQQQGNILNRFIELITSKPKNR